MKIILLGFPKSGTTSFQDLFEKMGLSSVHWHYGDNLEFHVGTAIYKARSERKPLFHYLKNFDCVTQMDVCVNEGLNFWPQTDLLEEIYEQYPEAIYILNTRRTNRILRSIQKWGSLQERILEFNNIKSYRGNSDDERICNWMEDHFTKVRTLFEGNPKFIEFNIEEDSLERLRDLLEIPGHITSFPHVNINKQTIGKKIKTWVRDRKG